MSSFNSWSNTSSSTSLSGIGLKVNFSWISYQVDMTNCKASTSNQCPQL
jgi:hypothetical protein